MSVQPRRSGRKRVLLIIAPTLYACHETALAFGLNPRGMEDVRCVTKAEQLRGLKPGTPFIAREPNTWSETPSGWELGTVLDLRLRTGALRLAQDDDIAACRREMREAAE